MRGKKLKECLEVLVKLKVYLRLILYRLEKVLMNNGDKNFNGKIY